MKILVDENIPAAQAVFGQFGQVETFAGRDLNQPGAHSRLRDVDALIVRSVTRVTPSLLEGSRVRFVGSATIGADHLDLNFLCGSGIAVATAPGSNADSVVDYVLSAICASAVHLERLLSGGNVGIIGYGNVGRRLAGRLTAMGVTCKAFDPLLPREGVLGSLDGVLRCDVVALHAPLTRGGEYPSYHMLDFDMLRTLPDNAMLLNAGRGEVISSEVLLALAERRPDLSLVLDVWEPEPAIPYALVQQCFLATPHIAGYSADGKLAGTQMIARALAAALDQPFDEAIAMSMLPSPPPVRVSGATPAARFRHAVLSVYDVREDDRRLREALAAADDQPSRSVAFDTLRRDYPLRRELGVSVFEGSESVIDPTTRRLLNAARGSK